MQYIVFWDYPDRLQAWLTAMATEGYTLKALRLVTPAPESKGMSMALAVMERPSQAE